MPSRQTMRPMGLACVLCNLLWGAVTASFLQVVLESLQSLLGIFSGNLVQACENLKLDSKACSACVSVLLLLLHPGVSTL